MSHPIIGKNVIVRANVAGVHVGTVEAVPSSDSVVLVNARRLWAYYTRDSTGSVSDIAANGLKEGANHSVCTVLVRVCITNPAGLELAEMTPEAYRSVMEYPVS